MPGAQNNILDLVRDLAAPEPYVFALWSWPKTASSVPCPLRINQPEWHCS
jgi:hypothetical protein